jgi:hypothetical protein
LAVVLHGLLAVVLTGCRSTPQAAPARTHEANIQVASVPTAAVPAPVASAKQAKPFRYSEPPVEQDETAGVRGTQIVKFVVLSEGKRIEGAHITVLNAHGKSEGDGTTDDWGEFHVGLAQAHYKVSIDWQGKRVVRQVNVDAATQSVDLKLD